MLYFLLLQLFHYSTQMASVQGKSGEKTDSIQQVNRLLFLCSTVIYLAGVISTATSTTYQLNFCRWDGRRSKNRLGCCDAVWKHHLEWALLPWVSHHHLQPCAVGKELTIYISVSVLSLCVRFTSSNERDRSRLFIHIITSPSSSTFSKFQKLNYRMWGRKRWLKRERERERERERKPTQVACSPYFTPTHKTKTNPTECKTKLQLLS